MKALQNNIRKGIYSVKNYFSYIEEIKKEGV